ncbi:MAG TPA: undecaprenyldiphospho-muramoylpentapeptide beta-N-acetylglucosaminyltransferase [Thermoanaerobaculia bacterium]|nr:undecaprenyldiphospho-muramoylpentapeptide beta-N-acetylglucosaminyltransferase [Thermoanaerobaculia bacterium]
MTGVQTLMIAGGGTGGHIYPAVAIAREYVARGATRRVVFVGTERGLEKQIVPKAGFPLELIDVGGLKGKGGLDLLRNLARLPLGFLQAWRVVAKHQPNVVLGVGGYSSGPVLAAAGMRRIPTIIHESNAFPGLANRILARFATKVAVAFKDAGTRMKRKDAVMTGNPIRSEFFEVEDRRSRLSGQAGLPVLHRVLLFGGSQGSHILNETMTAALPFLERSFEIVHQTGPREHEQVHAAYRSAFANARVVPYLDPIVDEIAAADLVVSRAGAMTIGELAAAGRAAILVPFAAATNNHQEINARVVEKAGGAIVITEKELTPERLAGAISEVLNDPERASRMGAAAKTLAMPGATKNIVDLVEQIQRVSITL